MALRRDRRPAAQKELGNLTPEVLPPKCVGKCDWQTTTGNGIFRCARCLTYGFARTKPGRFSVARVVAYRCSTVGCKRNARLKGRTWNAGNPSWSCGEGRCSVSAPETAPVK